MFVTGHSFLVDGWAASGTKMQPLAVSPLTLVEEEEWLCDSPAEERSFNWYHHLNGSEWGSRVSGCGEKLAAALEKHGSVRPRVKKSSVLPPQRRRARGWFWSVGGETVEAVEGIRRSLLLFHTRLLSEEVRLQQNVILVQKKPLCGRVQRFIFDFLIYSNALPA